MRAMSVKAEPEYRGKPMKNANPLFDPATRYRIVVQGRVDAEWLKSFDNSVEITVREAQPEEDITLLDLHTDQSGIIGLVRKLHGLGMTIKQLQIVSTEGEASEVEDQ